MVQRSYEAQLELNDMTFRNHAQFAYMFTQAAEMLALALQNRLHGNNEGNNQ